MKASTCGVKLLCRYHYCMGLEHKRSGRQLNSPY